MYEHLAGSLKSYRDLSLNFQEFLAGDKTKFNLSLVLMDPSFDEMLNVIDSENAKFSGKVTVTYFKQPKSWELIFTENYLTSQSP